MSTEPLRLFPQPSMQYLVNADQHHVENAQSASLPKRHAAAPVDKANTPSKRNSILLSLYFYATTLAPPVSTASISACVHLVLPNLAGSSLRSKYCPFGASTLPRDCPECPPIAPYASAEDVDEDEKFDVAEAEGGDGDEVDERERWPSGP